MNTSSRPILLYWVLLLLPTMAVGAGAVYFLRREHARIEQRVGAVEESRRTALRTRTLLAAENAELIVSDLQAGLLDTLANDRGMEPDAFLDSLQRSNPLVHATFRCTSQGGLLRPAADSEDPADAAFRRRFSGPLRAAAAQDFLFVPLSAPLPAKAQDSKAAAAKTAASEEAKSAGLFDLTEATLSAEPQAKKERDESYALNVQRARRDVQELSKLNEGSLARDKATRAAPAQAKSGEGRRQAKGEAKALASSPAPALEHFEVTMEETEAALQVQASVVSQARSGWLPLTVNNRLTLLGWYQPERGGELRGLELEMTALVSRLGAALPPDLGEREGLCLRDERGRLFHQAGYLPNEATQEPIAGVRRNETGLLLRLPLNRALLPGWTIEAWLAPAAEGASGDASAFILTGALLAGILMVSLLSGGVLLMMQARASAREALVKTSFVANVSHELKTPLTTIRLYADLLEQGRVRDEERRADYLRTIGRESERLSRLVNNVLDFSRLERGTRQLSCTELDLAAELAAVVATQAPRLAEAGLDVRIEEPEQGLPAVRADRDALGQVLLNLLDNAAKYASDGLLVTVSLALDSAAGALRVRVADRGPGVPAAERERIFEKFHRLDQGLTAEKGGAGLGLSIARQLARAMGGELRCLAREGGGAVFELSLPLSASKQK